MPDLSKRLERYTPLPILTFGWFTAFDILGTGRELSIHWRPIELAALGAVTALYGFGLWLSRANGHNDEAVNAFGVASVIGVTFVFYRLIMQ